MDHLATIKHPKNELL